MSEDSKPTKHLPKIFSEKVARDRVRFWYWRIENCWRIKYGKKPTPRQLEIQVKGDSGPLPGERGSRIWAKYRAGKATPMMGRSSELAKKPNELHIVDLVELDPDFKHANSKHWLTTDLWRLMDEENPMAWAELWTTFRTLPDYWAFLVDGSIKYSEPNKRFWRLIDDKKRADILRQVDEDLRDGELEVALRAIYALVQDALLRQSESDYSFWRKQAERIEQDPDIEWLGKLPRIR